MNQKKIAIDIVLLPPKEIIGWCIKINRKAAEQGNARRPLGRNDYLPHISLGMGCVDRSQLPPLFKQIKAIISPFTPLPLEIVKLYNCGTKAEPLYWLSIAKNKDILKLHEGLMKKIPFTYKATKNMFFTKKSEVLKNIPRSVQDNFRKKYSFNKFKPHLTLWVAKKPSLHLPTMFIASTVAVFHLGEGATCRKKLLEVKLRKR